ncbi:MAG: nucleotidyltransferase family protein [Candidatus Brocadiia bacterium]
MDPRVQDFPVCLLAGGLSTRLRPITDSVPKSMVPVGDRPFLQLLLDHFGSLGFRRFVLAVSYRWEQIEAYFGDGARFGWRIEYSVEPEPLGTGGALLWAQPLWRDAALVANADTFLPEDWRAMLRTHREQGLPATMALARQDDCSRFGKVTVREGRVAGFEEKKPHAGPGWINGGVYVMSRQALEPFKRGTAFSLEKDVFPRLSGRIAAYTCDAGFADIGTMSSLEEFRKQMAGGLTPEKQRRPR